MYFLKTVLVSTDSFPFLLCPTGCGFSFSGAPASFGFNERRLFLRKVFSPISEKIPVGFIKPSHSGVKMTSENERRVKAR